MNRVNLFSALSIALSPGIHSRLPSLPAPKPAKRLTAADLNRIEAALELAKKTMMAHRLDSGGVHIKAINELGKLIDQAKLDHGRWFAEAQSAEPVQGEATVKECFTVELVENSTYGGLHIKEWHNHGLSAGRHKLYTSPAKPDAELVELLHRASSILGSQGFSAWDDLASSIDAKLAELQS